MKKAPVGTVVYIKRHALLHRDNHEKPRTVIGHLRKKSGNIVAVLDTGEHIEFGELTDVPCSQMECGRCKWHKQARREQGGVRG